jgi:hypothetical protein
MGTSFPSYDLEKEISPDADPVEQVGVYEEMLEAGHEKGFFGVTPKDETGRPPDDTRLRTVQMQLWLLGYLSDKPNKHDPAALDDDIFRQALGQFRIEAGIEPPDEPGMLDDTTWYCLHALVAFESMEGTALTEERLDRRWFVGDKPRKALRRAVQLRLYTLGLRDERPKETLDDDQSGILHPFKWILILFERDDVDVSQGFSPELIAALFDQDRLMQMLADAGPETGSFEIDVVPGRSTSVEEQRRLARAFIVNAAKIELWLFGIGTSTGVQPDGIDNYRAAGLGGQTNEEMQLALVEAWTELGDCSPDEARQRAESLRPGFFKMLPGPEDVRDADPQSDYSKQVAEWIEDEDDVQEAWQAVQTHRMSLWDGVKRVWRWLKTKVKQVVSWFSDFFKNLARAFYRYASKGYKIVRLSITSVVKSIQFYVDGRLESRPAGRLVFTHDTDLDVRLIGDSMVEAETQSNFTERLHYNTAIFSYGARILGFAVSTIIRLSTGLGGWVLLLKSLVQSLSDLKPHYEKLKTARSKLKKHERESASP